MRKEALSALRAEVLELFGEVTQAMKDLRSAATTAKSIAESQARQAQSQQKQAEKARLKAAQRIKKENSKDDTRIASKVLCLLCLACLFVNSDAVKLGEKFRKRPFNDDSECVMPVMGMPHNSWHVYLTVS